LFRLTSEISGDRDKLDYANTLLPGISRVLDRRVFACFCQHLNFFEKQATSSSLIFSM